MCICSARRPRSVEHVTSYLDRRTTPAAGDRAGCKKTDEWGAARDFLTRAKVFEAGESMVFDYTYDAAGNVTSELETLGSVGATRTTYAYDDVDRLTRSSTSDGVANAYAYDSVGNRTRWVSSDAPDTGRPLVVASQFNVGLAQPVLQRRFADTEVSGDLLERDTALAAPGDLDDALAELSGIGTGLDDILPVSATRH